MNPFRFQKAREALADIEEDKQCQATRAGQYEEPFHSFRQELEIAAIRCMDLAPNAPTEAEIKGRLQRLRGLATGDLFRFASMIERAQAALRG